jgi:quercetin dioxygenase-like cupin family protein
MGFLIGPDEGKHLPGEFKVTIKIRSEQTGGGFALLEQTLPPRRLIKPHTHGNDVWVYPLNGEVGVLVSDDVIRVIAGAWVLKPQGIPHAMWNPTDRPVRILEVMRPGGSERWFEEIAALADGDIDGFEEACVRHNIAFFSESPWTAELITRFGLRTG